MALYAISTELKHLTYLHIYTKHTINVCIANTCTEQVGINRLPRPASVSMKLSERDSNSRRFDCESDTLTISLPRSPFDRKIHRVCNFVLSQALQF